jgi:hypothetical protein
VWSLLCDRQAIVWGNYLGTNESSFMEHTRLVVRDLAKLVLTRPGSGCVQSFEGVVHVTLKPHVGFCAKRISCTALRCCLYHCSAC